MMKFHPGKILKAFFVFSLLLVLLGAVGFALFHYSEHYTNLQGKLRWAKQQEKILSGGLEDLMRKRKDLEKEQLEFSKRLTDQDQALKSLEAERTSLLEGIRRITERNRELSLKEEAAETARSEGADLARELGTTKSRAQKLDRISRKLKKELEIAKGQLVQKEQNFQTELKQIETRLETSYQERVQLLEGELEGLRERSAKVSRLLGRQEAMEKELAELKEKQQVDQASYFYNLAVAYTRSGLFRDAEKMYLKALEINSDDAGAHHNLGILYEHHFGQRQEALRHFRRYVELAPDEKEKSKVLRWIDEVQHAVGNSRRSVMRSQREAFDRMLLTTP